MSKKKGCGLCTVDYEGIGLVLHTPAYRRLVKKPACYGVDCVVEAEVIPRQCYWLSKVQATGEWLLVGQSEDGDEVTLPVKHCPRCGRDLTEVDE